MVRWGRYLLALVVVSVVAVVLRMDPNQLTHRVPQPRQAILLFAGDVMQHTPQIEAARRGVAYHYESVFESVHPYFSSADIAVVNLETTLSEEPPYTGYPLFRAPAALAHALARCGVDVACLANNHALDWVSRAFVARLVFSTVRVFVVWAFIVIAPTLPDIISFVWRVADCALR